MRRVGAAQARAIRIPVLDLADAALPWSICSKPCTARKDIPQALHVVDVPAPLVGAPVAVLFVRWQQAIQTRLIDLHVFSARGLDVSSAMQPSTAAIGRNDAARNIVSAVA